jgi:hypothetical protein
MAPNRFRRHASSWLKVYLQGARGLGLPILHIAHAAIAALAAEWKMTSKDVARAIKQYKIDGDTPNPNGV